MLSGKVSLRSIGMSIVSISIATAIFLETFGKTLLDSREEPGVDSPYEQKSKIIYVGASILGQLSYSLCSHLSTGFLILPAFDCAKSSRKIHQECIKRDPDGFINTLACLLIASLSTSAIALLFRLFIPLQYLKMLPQSIVVVMMLFSGAQFLLLGCSYYIKDIEYKSTPVGECLLAYIFMSISLLITVSLIILLSKKKDPIFLFVYVLVLTVVMNSLRLVGATDFLYKYKLFLFSSGRPLYDEVFFSAVLWKRLSLTTVLSRWSEIVSLSIFPIIAFTVNMQTYSSALGTHLNTGRELLACGVSNIASACSFYPVYFNCSGSIFFHMCGCNSPALSFISGVSLLGVFFLIHVLTRILPTFVTSLLTQFVGLSFILGYGPLFCSASSLDQFIMVSLLVLHVVFGGSTVVLLFAGVMYSCLVSYMFTGRAISRASFIQSYESDGVTVCKVSTLLDFRNIGILLGVINGSKLPVILDLSSCRYVDLTANILLKPVIREKARVSEIVGSPANFRQPIRAF